LRARRRSWPPEGEILGVGFLECHRKALGSGALAAAVEKRADVVRRHHVGEAAGCGKRRIAVTGGDVEDALAAAEIDGLAERFADDLQHRADNGIVAGPPGVTLTTLYRGKIDSDGGGCLDVHGAFIP
jgi:hypothetical protein